MAKETKPKKAGKPADKKPAQRRIAKTKTVTLKPNIIVTGERLAILDNRTFSNMLETLILREAKRLNVEVPEQLPEFDFKD